LVARRPASDGDIPSGARHARGACGGSGGSSGGCDGGHRKTGSNSTLWMRAPRTDEKHNRWRAREMVVAELKAGK
jgi:hypothetical protein